MILNSLNKAIPNGDTNSINVSSKKSSSSLKRYVIGTACSTLAIGALTHLIYQNFYSPSSLKHNTYESRLHSLYTQHVTSCSDSSFNAFQIFFNTFESPLYYLGLNSVNNPPGDLTAFVLDQNFEGAECSYSSYPLEQITQKMKNKLLGEVMRRQALLEKDFSSTIQWLIDKGADFSYSHPVKKSELKEDKAASYTPLLSAFESQNEELYKYLIEKGASPDARLYAYSKETQKWNERKPLIQEIVEQILNQQQTISNDRCKVYKSIIDLSIAKHNAGIHSFDSLSNIELEALIYAAIREGTSCSKHFPLKNEHKSQEAPKQNKKSIDPNSWDWSEILNKGMNAAQVLLTTFQKLWNEYFPGLPPENVDEACQILGIDPAQLAKMDKADAISTLKKACRQLKAKNHPDRGGDQEIFKKVAASCDKILDQYKGK